MQTIIRITILFEASIDLTGISASNETVRRMHDDNVRLSIRCVFPVKNNKWQW